jgi:hypothetical protein
MSTYISSNANRLYAAIENSYGSASFVTATNRFPTRGLRAHQSVQTTRRLDKTGTRTYLGASVQGRRNTVFATQSYLTSWAGVTPPAYGILFQAALGAPPSANSGLIIASAEGLLQFQTAAAHGLSMGSGISFANEVRFVSGIVDSETFSINAPFSALPEPGSVLSSCATYAPGTTLPSVTIYDYWDPVSAVSRCLVGAAVDVLKVSVNGDFHEFCFTGPAADLLDSSSFTSGTAGLASYPIEPSLSAFDYSLVPGHLGQVWLGAPTSQFFTLTGASIEVKNNIAMRNSEYGSSYPLAVTPGNREVISRFALLAQDDAQTTALYAAAKARVPIQMMLQLGQCQGQMMGIYMPKVVPELPMYNDSEPRLEWEFQNNLAQGLSNDEIYIAFA